MSRTWKVTITAEPSPGVPLDHTTIEVTAHCAWAACMRAQRQAGIDARDILAVVEKCDPPAETTP